MEKSKTSVLDQINEILLIKKGKLISKYENAQKKLIWECNKGHIFEKNWNHVKRGQWCTVCNWRNPTIKQIQELAKSKNGFCLSEYYVKSTDKLLWKCQNEHIWEASLNSIKNQNSWCPYCYLSVGENITRKYLEFIFKKPFVKIRPAWLINKDGYRLEFDGYC